MSAHRREAIPTLARIVRMRQKLTPDNNDVGFLRRLLRGVRIGIVATAH